MKLFDSGFVISRSRKSEDHHKQKDLEFILKLKVATLEELQVMLKNHSHKKTPVWKKIAIQRAIKRASPPTL